MEKNHVLNHSLNQSINPSPSLFDAPGTKACASENSSQGQRSRSNVTKIQSLLEGTTADSYIVTSLSDQ